MWRAIHPLPLLVARATEKDLGLYIEYLKAENRILQRKSVKRDFETCRANSIDSYPNVTSMSTVPVRLPSSNAVELSALPMMGPFRRNHPRFWA